MKKITLVLLILWTPLIWSQKYKYGKVSKAELEEKFYPLDSTADAAILYTERKTNFEYTYDKGFVIREEYYTRLKIYTKEGYDKATKEIIAFHNINGTETISYIKAVTYNLENGKIVKTKLKKKNIFKEEKNKYNDSKKFTMPNLKPGAIVEWKYTLESPFFGMLDEVKLQTDIPIKKVVAKLYLPEYFSYNTKTKGYLPIDIKSDSKERKIEYTYHYLDSKSADFVNGSSELVFQEKRITIEKTNIPALKDEAFSGNIDNYTAGVNYELAYIKYPNKPIEPYAGKWESIVEKIFLSDSFGGQLKKEKHFKQDLENALQGVVSNEDKIAKVLQFAKDKIKWNEYYGYHTDLGVKKAYKEGVGNVADINLNLVNMLRVAGLDANPVLVSTISHGIPIFPTRRGFNYVIARVITPEGVFLLDATTKNSLPNVLPDRVLNFKGRVVNKRGTSDWVSLFPEKHAIEKTTIKAKFSDEGFTGTARKSLSNNYSLSYRNSARGKSKENLIEWIDKKLENVDVINARVNNLDNLNKNVLETIQFETTSYSEEIGGKTYINPLLYKQIEKNPFKSEKREFPVYYNMPWAKTTSINLTIPDDYTIESVPESFSITFLDDIGVYNFTTSTKGQVITIEAVLVINSPVINAENYTELKEFYKNIITKETEKIVLVKK